MSEAERLTYESAVQDFRRARKQAALAHLVARFTGRSDELLSYNEVRDHLQASGLIEAGIREIPLKAIVGSVGRYKDFTREFLPRKDSNEERWARVRASLTEMKGWPPIEVYQIGEVYFVKDGNHRVSVARQLGVDTITAYVTRLDANITLEVDDDPTEIICKVRYAEFIEKTGLDRLRPDADLLMTFCGQYHVLIEQIETYRQQQAQEHSAAVNWEESVAGWYDDVYLPTVVMVREQGILRHFPRRTEADMYFLLWERREELEQALGWRVDTETAVSDLVDETEAPSLVKRFGRRLRQALVPAELRDGPHPGQWRKERLALRRHDQLFTNILVGIPGENDDWRALEQALIVAQREGGRLHGLHVIEDSGGLPGTDMVTLEQTPLGRRVCAAFQKRRAAAGVPGELALVVGDLVETFVWRAAWNDLAVVKLTQTESPDAAHLTERFKQFVQHSSRPILAVPGPISPLDRALLAYDGSPKADEALFVATYLAARWQTALTVVTVETDYTSSAALDKARDYLTRYGVTAEYSLRQKPIAEAVLETAESQQSNLLIMGGFGFRPVLHLMLGSTVDHILSHFKQPILICR
ncbi:MAG: universal stress protein [Chloroflexota bacterium]